MWTRCPVTDQPHDMSLTGFVDDVFKRTLFLTVAEAVRGVAQNDANLEKAMTPDGYAQNVKKKQLLVSVVGQGSQHLLREARAAAPAAAPGIASAVAQAGAAAAGTAGAVLSTIIRNYEDRCLAYTQAVPHA